jgi:hypothetical protein
MARKKTQAAPEKPPVVFYLRISEKNDEVKPIEESPAYSDLLSAIDNTTSERFSNEIIKPLIESIQRDKTYSEHTACFWCCSMFKGFQFALPITYDTYKSLYFCEGVYCSPECALAYLYSEYAISESIRWNRHVLLKNLYQSVLTDISPAPPRSMLRMFGGPLDVKQYRGYVSASNDIIVSSLPPIRVVFPSMNIQGPLKDVKRYVSLSNDTVDKASESLRLKRSKVPQPAVPTLDMCIKR